MTERTGGHEAAQPDPSQPDPVLPDGEDAANGTQDDAIHRFWLEARAHAGVGNVGVVVGETAGSAVAPPAWAFGDTPQLADALVAAVLDGDKTATSSALEEYGDGVPLPEVGELSILLDGGGQPRALVRTTAVQVTTFGAVTAEHAAAEGEDDRTLESWRREHRRYWERVLGHPVGDDLQVVCERFEVRYPR